MTLDSLKQQWTEHPQQSSVASLKSMLEKGDRSLNRVRRRLVIESFLLFIITLIFWDGFDGDKRPLIMSFLLVAAFTCVIANDLLLLLQLRTGDHSQNVRTSLESTAAQLKLQAWVSPLLLVVANGCWIGFFLSGVVWRQEKWFTVTIILLIITGVGFVTRQWWLKRLHPILASLEELSQMRPDETPVSDQPDSLT